MYQGIKMKLQRKALSAEPKRKNRALHYSGWTSELIEVLHEPVYFFHDKPNYKRIEIWFVTKFCMSSPAGASNLISKYLIRVVM